MTSRPILAALAGAILVSLPALAAEAPARPLDLAASVEMITKTYPGRVVAAQADASGGDALHYHVDVLLPNDRLARFDVNASTGRIYNRLPPESLAEGTIGLQDAVKAVEAKTRGRAVAAEFDPDPAPHFHVNVRLPGGKLARFDLDTATRAIAPHQPRA